MTATAGFSVAVLGSGELDFDRLGIEDVVVGTMAANDDIRRFYARNGYRAVRAGPVPAPRRAGR